MRIFLFFVFFCLYSYNLYAINIATFQFSKILDNSIQYNKFNNELNIFKDKIFFDLKKDEETLIIQSNKIKDSKVILNESEYEKKISEFNTEKIIFESKVEKYNNYIQSNIEYNENIILNEISVIVKDIVIDNKIDLVFSDNQFYLSADNIDISDIIINKLNQKNLQLKLNDFK